MPKDRHPQNGGLRDIGHTYPGTTQFKKKIDRGRKAKKAATKARRINRMRAR